MSTTTCSSSNGENFSELSYSESVLFHILSWLPVRSLLRFKSVCKSWYALIASPGFINQQLHNYHNQETNYSIFSMNAYYAYDKSDPSLFYNKFRGVNFLLLHGDSFELSKELDLPGISKVFIPFINMVTCNGIVCLSQNSEIVIDEDELEYTMEFSLWNPATKQFRGLPPWPVPISYKYKVYHISVGFGVDVKTNDYKVVRIFFYDNGSSKLGPVIVSLAEVYSLRTDTWRTIDAVVPADITFITSDPRTPYRNGTYCWFGRAASKQLQNYDWSFNHYVLSFDFSDEVFETTPLPDVNSVKLDYLPEFAILRDKIACINAAEMASWEPRANRFLEIWVLNEYGVKESWSKLYTVGPLCKPSSFTFLKNEEKFFFEREGLLCIYDPVTQGIRDLAVQGSTPNPMNRTDLQSALYKDSLVSIRSGNRTV